MTRIAVLPHPTLCPRGATLDAPPGRTVLNALLENGIALEHACEKSCACSTCHVHLRAGGASLKPAEEEEEDMLEHAWGLDPDSRLSCQAVIADQDLTVEIPKYTVNRVSERH